MKVGKPEHLDSFRDGNVYFSPLSRFRGDGTLFRGDSMEGKTKIDISKGFWVNGKNISDYLEEVTYSHVGSDDVLVFCAAILDDSNIKIVSHDQIAIDQKFLTEMRKFGQYAVVFDLEQFTACVTERTKQYQYDYGFRSVTYVDKADHAAVTEFFKENQKIFDSDAIYFLKDRSYANQHEWRYMLDHVPVERKNADGSYILKISGLRVSEIIDLDTAQYVPG